jgi:RNAse (barnase) inhibitor barstar
MPPEFVTEGTRITSLETFFDEIERAFAPPSKWGRNLDALDDLLSQEFGGIPAGSCALAQF